MIARDSEKRGNGCIRRRREYHSLFAQVYFHTTKHWIGHLADRADADIGYIVIERFYQLYDAYVRRVIDGRSDTIARHWAPYFRVADSLENEREASLKQWQLLFLGFKAHTRFDLAEAVFFSHQDYCRSRGHEPDMISFKRLLLGRDTNTLFYQAALDFVSSQRPRCECAQDIRVAYAGAQWLRHIWVPVFQRWRHAAWSDAISWINILEQKRLGPADNKMWRRSGST